MVLRGELAEMMVHIAPKIYLPYVTMDKKGTPTLYARLKKALYGLLRSSLLFYRNLCGELEEYGFEVNHYDPCVANKMVMTETVVPVIDKKGRATRNKNGSKKMRKVKAEKQITVVWYVDDFMMSCEDNFELTKLRGKIPARRKCYCIPPHHRSVDIPKLTIKEGHPDRCVLPNHKG